MSDLNKGKQTQNKENRERTPIPKKLSVFAPILAAVMVAACVVASLSSYSPAVYEVLAMPTQEESDETKTETESDEGTPPEGEFFDLEDGIYYGSGTGYAGRISVAVTIASKQITAIEVTEVEADDEAFFTRAKGVIDEIISTQSLDVDVVSGATYSSRGIISAVRNALTGEEDAGETAETETGQGETTVEAVTDAAAYNDGVYYGSATGFRGLITVKVVIENGQITSIEITDSSDDTAYLNRASALIASILSGQSTNVDTVSGATYSSVGIINAVRNALAQAAVSGSSESTAQLTVSSSSSSGTTFSVPVVEAGESGAFPYPDGVYYGTAEGWGGDITVSVTIKDQTITAVTILSAEDETEEYFSQASVLAESIVTAQSTDLDVVSGATYSSNGILNAVRAALASAQAASGSSSGDGDSVSDSSTDSSSESGADSQDSTGTEDSDTGDSDGDENTSELYADGFYTVSVVCSPDEDEDFDSYNLTATVGISGDRIVSITDISGDGDSDNDKYITWAANGRSTYVGIVDQVVALQKGNVTEDSVAAVDVVSRATCSSDALKELCQEALRQAAAAFSEKQASSADTESGNVLTAAVSDIKSDPVSNAEDSENEEISD
ncbi:MAG: FMN-binding protein [Clostridiales bacterium]|nr:FMN-binding protein [Clostridiales bacterium]